MALISWLDESPDDADWLKSLKGELNNFGENSLGKVSEYLDSSVDSFLAPQSAINPVPAPEPAPIVVTPNQQFGRTPDGAFSILGTTVPAYAVYIGGAFAIALIAKKVL